MAGSRLWGFIGVGGGEYVHRKIKANKLDFLLLDAYSDPIDRAGRATGKPGTDNKMMVFSAVVTTGIPTTISVNPSFVSLVRQFALAWAIRRSFVILAALRGCLFFAIRPLSGHARPNLEISRADH